MPINRERANKYMRLLVWAILFSGIVFRIWVYCINRNLVQDEANVARNIFEREYGGLLGQLSYEQYAPPVFLWITKTITLVLGYSEYAFRLYPLICGFLALYLLYRVLGKLVDKMVIWYPVAILAWGFTFIRYSTELKQYMPDVLCTLVLLYMAITIDIVGKPKNRFILTWLLAGSIAIWSSMPSIFILTGVGAYYLLQCIEEKRYNLLHAIIIPGIAWMIQFALYYFLLLKGQANSSYLQGFHQPYFLQPVTSMENWQHDWHLLQSLIAIVGGYTGISVYFNLGCIIIGLAGFFYNSKAMGALFAIPLVGLLAAAFLGQFSLLDRVSLFIMPVLLVLIGYGMCVMFVRAKYAAIKALPQLIALISIISFAGICLKYPWRYEEVCEGLTFTRKHGIEQKNVFLYHGTVPSFIYYTTIHPKKNDFADYKTAGVLGYGMNTDSLAQMLPAGSYAFVYTNQGMEDYTFMNAGLEQNMKELDKLYKPSVRCFIVEKQ